VAGIKNWWPEKNERLLLLAAGEKRRGLAVGGGSIDEVELSYPSTVTPSSELGAIAAAAPKPSPVFYQFTGLRWRKIMLIPEALACEKAVQLYHFQEVCCPPGAACSPTLLMPQLQPKYTTPMVIYFLLLRSPFLRWHFLTLHWVGPVTHEVATSRADPVLTGRV